MLLRHRFISLLVTKQAAAALVLPGSVEQFDVAPCDAAQRAALVQLCGAPVEWARELPSTATPFDITLAAQAWAELPANATPYEVRHAHVDKLLHGAGAPAFSRGVLRDLAHHMNRDLRHAVAVHEFRVLGERQASNAAERGAIHQLETCALLHLEQGAVSFSHENFETYFLADRLLAHADQCAALVAAMDRPRAVQVAPLVLQAQTRPEHIKELLRSSVCIRRTLGKVAAGECGQLAREALLQEAGEVLADSERQLRDARLAVTPQQRGVPVVSFEAPWKLTDYQHAVLRCLGQECHASPWFELVRDYFRATDRELQRRARRLVPELGGYPGNLDTMAQVRVHHAAYAVPSQMPSAMVLQGLESNRPWRDGPALDDLLADLDGIGAGSLLVVCLLARPGLLQTGEQASPAPCRLADLVRRAWGTRWSYLRLVCLDLVANVGRTLPTDLSDEVRIVLEAVGSPNNMFLASAYLEALEALGAVFEAGYSPESLRARITAVLATPDEEAARAEAYAIYGMQFEPLEAISLPAVDAVADLQPPERTRFLAMACLGAQENGFFSFALPAELIRQPAASENPWAREALMRWANAPQGDHMSPHERAAAFMLSNVALGRWGVPLSSRSGPLALAERAWSAFAEIYRQMDASPAVRSARTLSASWEFLAAAAIDDILEPVCQLAGAAIWEPWNVKELVPPLEALGDPLRELLERVVRELQARPASWRDGSLRRFHRDPLEIGILALGGVGDGGSRERLLPLADDPVVGTAAVDAIRSIDARLAEQRRRSSDPGT
ncbi:MAG: hypothetical protein HY744_34450 [Deltaproteobacteria bacterium]|nr:hypothetical protein [Deltaproteobacteria bacterium]